MDGEMERGFIKEQKEIQPFLSGFDLWNSMHEGKYPGSGGRSLSPLDTTLHVGLSRVLAPAIGALDKATLLRVRACPLTPKAIELKLHWLSFG